MVDKLLGGLADQALIVGEFGGREDVFGLRRFDQEAAARAALRGAVVVAIVAPLDPSKRESRPRHIRDATRARPFRLAQAETTYGQTRSKIPAAPMPPPMHMVTMP